MIGPQRYTVVKQIKSNPFSWAVLDNGAEMRDNKGMSQEAARSECDRLRKIAKQVGTTQAPFQIGINY